jgi:tetratricopeptide (TPR) repeat protein
VAAARVKVLTAEEIARRLSDQFKLLTGSPRSSLPRHQTLRAAMDWSYDLLSDQERGLLRKLSVFAGGWTLEAAEAICTGQGNEKPDALDVLIRLIDKSLVVAEEHEGKQRYRLLETVRQYAQDRLIEQAEAAAVRERHRDFFLALGEEAGQHLRGVEQLLWLNRLESEHDNLRAALEWSQGGDDPELRLRLAVALWPLWRMRGHFKEGRKWLEATLAPTGMIRTKARASALRAAGTLARDQGDPMTARTRFDESIAISRELNDPQGVADSLLALGHLPLMNSDADTAAAVLEDALAISRTIGYRWGVAESVHLLGHAALVRGEHAHARRLFEESVAKFRELGNKWSSAHPLRDVGREALRQGDYVNARSLFKESLTIFRELRSKSGMAMLLADLGDVAAAEGDYASASARFEESLVLYRDLGARRAIAELLNTQAEIGQHRGHYEEVRTLIDQAMELSKDLNDKWEMARSLRTLGNLARWQDEPERAKALFKESLTLARASGNKQGIIMCLVGLAGVGLDKQPASGSRLLGAAESLRKQLGAALPAMYHHEYERTVSVLRSALGEEGFAVAWAEGEAMTPEQAVEFALEVDGV